MNEKEFSVLCVPQLEQFKGGFKIFAVAERSEDVLGATSQQIFHEIHNLLAADRRQKLRETAGSVGKSNEHER